MAGPDEGAGAEGGRGPTPICAIGASAGGVRALQAFFRQVPKNLGLSYVVILHVSPDHPSAMPEILAGVTDMPVRQVTDAPRLEPDSVYVIPPDRELVIDGDDVTARPFSAPRGHRAPIDMFFQSIAAARGDGLAIVLSGAGSDGATGVRAVKEAGGVVLVQEPAEAEYAMMPQSAIATGAADFVGRIETLVERVVEVTQSKEAVRALSFDEDDQNLRRILSSLRARTGHDFASYKRATILRRIARRMQVTRISGLRAYSEYLVGNPEEAQALFDDLLICVTGFFRDAASFETLAERAIGPILDGAQEEGVRAWVAGCATGEEAYSLAILFQEEVQRRKIATPIQIFASDLDEGALATAREGRYPSSIEAQVSDERLKRWFVREGSHYRIKKEVRDTVLFASHSVLKDPPFMRLDLITCRNLLIYLEREVQRQVCTLFHYGLRDGGFLFLGSAETVEAAPQSFSAIDREARLYQARPIPRRSLPILSNLPPDHRPPGAEQGDGRRRAERRRAPEGDQSVGAAHVQTREQLAPPSALVDAEHAIQHLSASAARFLLPGEGAFTADLVAQVRPELRLDMAGALRRALEHGEPTLTLPLPVAFNGHKRRVALQVAPAPEEEGAPIRRAVVFFLDGGPVAAPEEAEVEDDGADVRRLREELRLAEERLSLARTEHEDAIQDLRIANEELQSINEEYRSTSEELETSKEELQSMNEELQTVNTELKVKLESISTAHSDLRNLVTSTEIGTLFLDPELRIRMFTPAVTQFFSVTEADVGRRITDFTHRLEHDGLEGAAAQVLRDLTPHEEEVASADGRWLIMRLRPYRTVDDRIDGLVVTFVDVTARKTAEDALAAELRAMRRLQQLASLVVEAEAVEEPLGEVLDAAMDLLAADFGDIRFFNGDGHLKLGVQRGLPQAFEDAFSRLDAESGAVCAIALAERRQVAVEDVETDERLAPALEAFREAGIRGVLSTPLLTGDGALVGMISVYFSGPRAFSDQDLRLMTIFARPAADAVHAARLQDRLRRSEARQRKVLETEAVAVLFFDEAGVVVDSNDAWLKMSGYTRDQIERGELSWQGMTPPEHVAVSEAQLGKLAETGTIGPYEKEYILADGSRRWILFAGRQVEPDLIAEYAIDISDRKRAETEREMLARELSHRVKNTLAVVQALAMQTRAETVEAFRDAYLGRLRALSQAHGLLLETDWRGADLGALVREAMAAYGDGGERVRLEGGAVEVSAKQALTLSLALHELATNAVKYGALSAEGGSVRIDWREEAREGATHVVLDWREEGGPPVTAPTRRGFGSRMMERALEYDLGGWLTADWAPEGLRCEIRFPKEEETA